MKTVPAFLAALLVLSASSTALAHPPGGIDGYYDLERQELNFTVQHIVNDRKEHFIDEVEIYKGGREVVKKKFDFQTSRRNQTMPPFQIPAQIGDSFRVKARCNHTGEYEVTIQVTDEKPDVKKLN